MVRFFTISFCFVFFFHAHSCGGLMIFFLLSLYYFLFLSQFFSVLFFFLHVGAQSPARYNYGASAPTCFQRRFPLSLWGATMYGKRKRLRKINEPQHALTPTHKKV